MKNSILKILEQSPLFSSLTIADREHAAKSLTTRHVAINTVIYVQAKSTIDNLTIVAKGAVELFYRKKGEEQLRKVLEKGDVFGGIAMLMNSGQSFLTARAVEDCELLLLPRQIFLEICIRHKFFYEFFEKSHQEQLKDPAFASVAATCRSFVFLKTVAPFTRLPEEVIEEIASRVSFLKYPEGTILFVQEQTKVQYLYIIQKGAAERYYEESDRKVRGGLSGEGTVYGGISMLLNDGIAVRTLRINEESYFYTLPEKDFLEICAQNPSFGEYFTDAFGARMMEEAYAELILKSVEPGQEAIQAFNQPVSQLLKGTPLFCNEGHSIREAASMMRDHGTGAIFVRNDKGDYLGLVTESDLAQKVVPDNLDINQPVSLIMSTPAPSISDQALLYEAHLQMIGKDVRNLAIKDSGEKFVGVISRRDLLLAQARAPFFTISEIGATESVEELFSKHENLPELIQGLLEGGAAVKNITRFITTFSGAILNKLIEFAIRDLGPPPVRFAFMIMGSEGRLEQTLKTDQDNAIVFEDVDDEKLLDQAEQYFYRFGEKVCGWLDKSGYAFCQGGIMAKNPKWSQPLAVWKQHFSSWIFTAAPEDLLEASIFFDFRGAYGDMELIKSLRKFLSDSLIGWPGFFRHLTENALYYKPPLGFFGNILVDSKGEHRDAFDIKAAMRPITDFARIYALQHHLEETNTQERLSKLHLKKVLSLQEYNELEQAYCCLMQLRFRCQVQAKVEEKKPPDNFVDLKKLTRIERTMLKEAFKRIGKLQSKLNFDFIGLV